VKTDTARPKLFCAGSSGYTPLSGCPPTKSVDVGPGNELNCKIYYFISYKSAIRPTGTTTTTTTSTILHVLFPCKRPCLCGMIVISVKILSLEIFQAFIPVDQGWQIFGID